MIGFTECSRQHLLSGSKTLRPPFSQHFDNSVAANEDYIVEILIDNALLTKSQVDAVRSEGKTGKALIEALGVNCIGCEDAYRRYLLDFNPSSGHSQNNYLYKVCPYAPDSNPVYIITVSYYT